MTKGSPLKLTYEMLAIVLWFSMVAWIIDVNFRKRQLRVVNAYNKLVSSAIENLPEGEEINNINIELLHISGEQLEDVKENEDIPIQKCLMPSMFIYLGTSLVSIGLFYVQQS